MDLVSAVLIATAFEVSPSHTTAYTAYMQQYLRGLKELFPTFKFRDNHHVVLHLEELLNALGPVHSWWMFPFEHLIGKLVKISTNWILGQMEVTMMKTFSATANIRGLLFSTRDMPGIFQCQRIFKDCFPDNYFDSQAVGEGGEVEDENDGYFSSSEIPLGKEIHAALAMCLGTTMANLNGYARFEKQIKHYGCTYASYSTTEHDSLAMVYALDDSEAIPVRISHIFTPSHQSNSKDTNRTAYIAIRRYLPPAQPVDDPYLEFPVLKAKLYSNNLSENVEVVRLSSIWCHFALCEYDQDRVVVVPLNYERDLGPTYIVTTLVRTRELGLLGLLCPSKIGVTSYDTASTLIILELLTRLIFKEKYRTHTRARSPSNGFKVTRLGPGLRHAMQEAYQLPRH
ncbi:hypothetical protein K439DRAFT_1618134 [Ramaria rubella]|nr:hypothetical protein K439DRAFT_1618134 [Ramaria rubella]